MRAYFNELVTSVHVYRLIPSISIPLCPKQGNSGNICTCSSAYTTHQIESEDYWVQILCGETSCPPKDAGGVLGYKEILRIINTSSDEEYEDTLTWLGEGSDPYNLDHRLTQARVNDFMRTIGEARWGFYRK